MLERAARRTAGRPDDAAALIYDGTLPTQETIARHARRARRARAKQPSDRRPAILVVGRVAALREHLRWFDARPLFGKRILVTRPREQAAELVERLEALGAEAIEAPMIRIVPPDDYGPLDEACARVGDVRLDRLLERERASTRSSSGCWRRRDDLRALERRAGSAPSGRRPPSGWRGTASRSI